MMGRSRSLKPSGIHRHINIIGSLFREVERPLKTYLTLIDAIVKFGLLVGPQSKDVDKSFPIEQNAKHIQICLQREKSTFNKFFFYLYFIEHRIFLVFVSLIQSERYFSVVLYFFYRSLTYFRALISMHLLKWPAHNVGNFFLQIASRR